MAFVFDTKAASALGVENPKTLAYTPGAGTKLLAVAIFGATTTARTGGAVYYKKGLPVPSPVSFPRGFFISPDGTELYIADNGADTVYQYTLSTAWNIYTATYANKNCPVGTQATQPFSVFFSSDGTKMYVMDGTSDTVYQYTLTTAWDLSSASYANKSCLISGQGETTPYAVTFSSDGYKMYVVGSVMDTVYQYTLTTAWDVSTASYASKSYSIGSQETDSHCLAFSSDGYKMYIAGDTADSVFQYTLTTAWDVSSASYASKSYYATLEETDLTGIFFSSDGTKMYLVGIVEKTFHQYALSTAWDVSTASAYDTGNLSQVGGAIVGEAECTTELWYLPVSSSGRYIIIVPNGGALSLQIQAFSFTSTGGTPTLFGNTSTNVTAANPALTINSVPIGSCVVSVLGSGYKNVITGRSDVELYSVDEAVWNSASQYEIMASTANTTHSFTQSSDDVAMIMAAWEEGNLPASVNDAIGVTDEVSAEIAGVTNLEVNIYDNVSVTDEPSITIPILAILVFSLLSLTDFVEASINPYLVSVSDNIDVTDSTSSLIPFVNVSVYDSISVTDDIVIERIEAGYLDIAVYDDIGLTDIFSAELSLYEVAVDDDVGLTDETSLFIPILEIFVFDSIDIVDDVSDQLTIYEISLSDAINVTDETSLSIPILEVLVFDSIAVTDLSDHELSLYQISVFDSLDVSDVVALVVPVLEVSVSDDIGITDDTVSQLTVYEVVANDLVQVSDETNISIPVLFVSVDDALDVSDEISIVIPVVEISVSDDISVSDVTGISIPILLVSVTDNIGVTDDAAISILAIWQVNVSDDIAVTDEVAVNIPILEISVFDEIGLSDFISGSLNLYEASVSDNLDVSDFVDILQVSAGVLTVSVFDNIDLSDETVISIPVLLVSISNDVDVTDSVNAVLTLYEAAADDTIILTDEASVFVSPLEISVFDSVNVSDEAILSIPILIVSVSDLVDVSDGTSLVVVAVLQVSVFDTVAVTDVVSGSLNFYEIAVSDSINLTDSPLLLLSTDYEGRLDLLESKVNAIEVELSGMKTEILAAIAALAILVVALGVQISAIPGNVWDISMADHTAEASFGGEVQQLDPNITILKAYAVEWDPNFTTTLTNTTAIKAVTDIMEVKNTTVSAGNDANSFTIAAGLAVDDAYEGLTIYIKDATDGNWDAQLIVDYTAGRVVTVDAPFAFVPAVADIVVIWGLTDFPIDVANGLPLPPEGETITIDLRATAPGGGTMTLNELSEDP